TVRRESPFMHRHRPRRPSAQLADEAGKNAPASAVRTADAGEEFEASAELRVGVPDDHIFPGIGRVPVPPPPPAPAGAEPSGGMGARFFSRGSPSPTSSSKPFTAGAASVFGFPFIN